jgi:hypothetical protein
MLTVSTIAVLPPLHPDERDEFQFYVYMSSPESAAKGGPERGVRELRLQRLCVE